MIGKAVRLSIALTLMLVLAYPIFSQQKKKNSDVDNIGNRNINKGNIDFTSIEKEVELGRQLAAEVEKEVKLLEDPVVNEYVNRVGQNLVRNSDAQVPFTIKVVDSDEINAFALPGGFFYVNTGLITAADNEAELAGVMGHEIAHVCARHAMENASKAQLANIATIPLIFLGGPLGMGARQAAQLAVPLEFLHFSRNNEAEADYLGLQYMYKAGYDPTAFVSFFEKLEALEAAKPGSISKLFSTHPPTPDRIEATKQNIELVLKDHEQYVLDTSEFHAIKDRIAMLEKQASEKPASEKPASEKPEDTNKPILRRTKPTEKPGDRTDEPSSAGKDPSTTSDPTPGNDGPPVLKRRPGSPR
jgi:predicted Zn-dependent protease